MRASDVAPEEEDRQMLRSMPPAALDVTRGRPAPAGWTPVVRVRRAAARADSASTRSSKDVAYACKPWKTSVEVW